MKKLLLFILTYNLSLSAKSYHKDFSDITESTRTRCGQELAPHLQRSLAFNLAQDNEQKTLIILVHGTFSNDNKNYYADDTRCFESMKEFARDVRTQLNTSVELISFGWNGLNTDAARTSAGKKLAQLLNNHYPSDTYQQIITVAQSHGGNVVNIATHFLNNRSIDVMVHLATPVREDDNELYKPINFGCLYAFYSQSDPIQYLGSFDINAIKRSGNIKFAKNRHFVGDGAGTIYNIHTQINSYCPGHLELRNILAGLYPILEEINNYKLHHTLEFNIDLNDFGLINTNHEFPILVAIREPLKERTQPEAHAKEIAQSELSKKRYRELYKKEMTEYISKSTYRIRRLKEGSSSLRDEFSEFFSHYA